MRFSDRAVLFFSTGAGIGYIPVAPGTFGTLWGLPLGYGLSRTGMVLSLSCTILLTLCAVWVAGRAETLIGSKDAQPIVIDEVAGFLVTVWGLPFNLVTAGAGFLVFRALDIAKPFPIRQIERTLPGGAGVVLDDVAAGLYGNLLLRAVWFAAAKMS